MKVSDVDILIGALTIHGEARGDTQEGRTAVAHCILNRMSKKSWWGKDVAGHDDHTMAAVCLKPWQFSCWNKSDPNSLLLRSLQERYREAIQQKACRASLKALIDALDGYAPDQTGGATHYLTTRLHQSVRCPLWARGNNNFIEIGKHRFFAGIR
jgi:N-acetylmuramoyl-L-alanine amidase